MKTININKVIKEIELKKKYGLYPFQDFAYNETIKIIKDNIKELKNNGR
jgi:hypothetical protein